MLFRLSPREILTALQYSIGFGTGDMHDFIGKASFRGFTLDYRNLATPISVLVLTLAGICFMKKRLRMYTSIKILPIQENNGVTAIIFPMLAAADYYVKPDANVSGYAGLGVGTMYTLQNTDMATYTFEKDAWHFALRPEVGLLFKAAPGCRHDSRLEILLRI